MVLTVEQTVVDLDVLIVDGTVEGDCDHHREVGDLGKALGEHAVSEVG